MASCDIPVTDHQYDFACTHQKCLLDKAARKDWAFACKYWVFVEKFASLQKQLRRALTLEAQTEIRKEIELHRQTWNRLYPWDKIRFTNKIFEVQMHHYKFGRHWPH